MPGRENVVANALCRCHPLILVPYPQSVSAFQEMTLPRDHEFLKLVKAFHELLAHTGVKSLIEKLQAAGHNHACLQDTIMLACSSMCNSCASIVGIFQRIVHTEWQTKWPTSG